MQIEKYVVSLELAIKLKEKGYPQEDSLFYWAKLRLRDGTERWIIVEVKPKVGGSYAAPISDEILEKLPRTITVENMISNWYVRIFCNEVLPVINDGVRNLRLPDALASLWLKLKEGGYL